MAPTMVSKPAQELMGMGKRHVIPDSWECRLPNLRPVSTTGRSLAVRESSYTGQKSVSSSKSSLTLDSKFVSDRAEEEESVFNAEESGCKTPKAKEHRIPDVDIDFCPPAPKKARGMGRLALICAIEFDNPELVSKSSIKMRASPCYLF